MPRADVLEQLAERSRAIGVAVVAHHCLEWAQPGMLEVSEGSTHEPDDGFAALVLVLLNVGVARVIVDGDVQVEVAPCRAIAPIVEQIAAEHSGRLKVVKLDVDENGGVAAKYNVMSIPTLGIFSKGELIERIVGYMPKEQLKKRIDAALATRV